MFSALSREAGLSVTGSAECWWEILFVAAFNREVRESRRSRYSFAQEAAFALTASRIRLASKSLPSLLELGDSELDGV